MPAGVEKPPWPGLAEGGILDAPSEAVLKTIYFIIFACIELALMNALLLVRVAESLAIDSTFEVPSKVKGPAGVLHAEHLDFWCNPGSFSSRTAGRYCTESVLRTLSMCVPPTATHPCA